MLLNLADEIDGRVRAAAALHEYLPQAILTRAFRGELVPTEAELAADEGRSYEPVSILLERIHDSLKQNKPAKRGAGDKKMPKGSGRPPIKTRRPLDEVLREQGKPLTTERLFDLSGF